MNPGGKGEHFIQPAAVVGAVQFLAMLQAL
jgi:hypothetical protein